MNGVNKTLYIPLYGKAYVTRKGVILRDEKALEIWESEGFPLGGKSRSKWLAYYMGMRAAVYDRWLIREMAADPETVVLHIGCGLDSRVLRVGTQGHRWYDVDFPEVVAQRGLHYAQTPEYTMVQADIRDPAWLDGLPSGSALVVMEGVSMYLTPEELNQLLTALGSHFSSVRLLMDCYTTLGAKLSKIRNPIQDVGVTQVYGLDDPLVPAQGTVMEFVKEHAMTPKDLMEDLQGMERRIFSAMYAGGLAKRLYRLYEYRKHGQE